MTQMSCICSDGSGKVLVVSNKPGKWGIPGGHPEEGESMEETVRREVLEEACIELEDVKLLGVMKIHFKDNPNKSEGDDFLQARFVGKIDKILDSKIDEATGTSFERKFIDPSEFAEYVKWPEAQELLDLAFKES